MLIHKLMRRARLMAPETGDSTGGGADRGDLFVGTTTPEPKAETPAAEAGAEGEDKSEGENKPEGEEKAEPDSKGKKAPHIPVERHQEILRKERERREALERQLATMQQGQEALKTSEKLTETEDRLIAMEKEYLSLLEKGEVGKAAEKMAEIRRTERSIVEAQADLKTQAAEARAYERVKYDTTVERLEAAFPVLNPDHDDYDREKVAEVSELFEGYLATNKYSRTEALQKAVRTLLKPATVKQDTATTVDVRVDKDDVQKAVREERKGEAVKKAVDAAGKQPATPLGVGKDSDKAGGKLVAQDVIKMDQKTFATLADADLAALRGDTV